MKKTLLFLMTAVSAAAMAAQASASENFEFNPYVGVDYSYSNEVAKHLRPNYNSGSINVGTDYNRFFGTELFYQYSDESKKGHNHASDRRKMSFQAGGLDLMGYLPLTCGRDLALIGTAGIGLYNFRTKYQDPNIKGGHDHGIGYRVGGGATYSIDNNWSVRALVRYVGLDQIKDADHMMEYSAGVRYTF